MEKVTLTNQKCPTIGKWYTNWFTWKTCEYTKNNTKMDCDKMSMKAKVVCFVKLEPESMPSKVLAQVSAQ